MLVEWEKLGIGEQEMLSGLYDEAEVYGVFRPVLSSANLTLKVAYKEVALLYMHLQHSDTLPRYILTFSDGKSCETIAQLVLDGILEIEYEGKFVSGAAALKALYGEMLSDGPATSGRLAVLSMEGIRYALHLRDLDMRSLSNRLYTFNTIPWDVQARSKFLSHHSVKVFLFPAAQSETNMLLNKHWQPNDSSEEKYWFSWWKRGESQGQVTANDLPTYKLYISPVISDLPRLLNPVIKVLSSSKAFSFKIGATLQGLLRPDKMVAYFNNWLEMGQAAAAMSAELNGFTPHGVPFTAQIDETGILSWGVDPAETDVLSAIEAGSWRMRVTDHLALAIISAQTDQLDTKQALQFIRAKLYAAGINTEAWAAVNVNEKISS